MKLHISNATIFAFVSLTKKTKQEVLEGFAIAAHKFLEEVKEKRTKKQQKSYSKTTTIFGLPKETSIKFYVLEYFFQNPDSPHANVDVYFQPVRGSICIDVQQWVTDGMNRAIEEAMLAEGEEDV